MNEKGKTPKKSFFKQHSEKRTSESCEADLKIKPRKKSVGVGKSGWLKT